VLPGLVNNPSPVVSDVLVVPVFAVVVI